MIHVDPASPDFSRLSKKEKAKIYYFDIGWDERAICDELDVPSRKVERWLDEEVATPKHSRACRQDRIPTAEDCERDHPEVCTLFKQGKSAREIITELGMPQSTVYHVLKRRFGSLRQLKEAA